MGNISDIQKNSEILKKYSEFFNGIRDCIEKINDTKLGVYDTDFMKFKFNSDDDIPLNKEFYFPTLTSIIRCVFEINIILKFF